MINYYLISFGIYLWLMSGMLAGYFAVRKEYRADIEDIIMIFTLCPIFGIGTWIPVAILELMSSDFSIRIKVK